MTINEVLKLVKEREVEKAKTQRVPHFYKRNGKMVERSYPDYIYTDRFIELNRIIAAPENYCFQCEDCGNYFQLETWACDFEEGEYICSDCYEEEIGEDL